MEYLEKIRPYLRDMTNDLKKSGEWKTQQMIRTDFMLLENIGEKRMMHFKSDDRKIMTGFDTHEIIEKLFDSVLQRYQEGLEKSIKWSHFLLDFVDGTHYKCHMKVSNVISHTYNFRNRKMVKKLQ